MKKKTRSAIPAPHSPFYAVIMAGGKGERFWPASTSKRPKQLLSLVGEKTLLAQAVERLDGLIPPQNIFVITNRDLVKAARKAAPMLPAKQIIGEPMGRDTAAAIALGAALIAARNPEATFCVLTADQVIGNRKLFQRTLGEGLARAAKQDELITIGMQPVFPSTGFGYIEAGNTLGGREGIAFHKAERFVEKPDQETAEEYVRSGKYYWNGGMFIWSVRTFTRALAKHRPPLLQLLEKLRRVAGTAKLDAVLAREYPKLEKISVDYALMEKANNIVMIHGEFPWDDVGSWPALENHIAKNAEGNTVVGDYASLHSTGNIVMSRGRLTALIGVKDLIVVQAKGVTLVCAKDKAQDIKKMVEQLKAGGQHDEVL
ncbi:MAG: mannose-1-phosphate guanyltransferase [Verrucomicrobia bacterium]|nr:MAG: mannose-1-phosphate guanyltransferase [Verrucomicrobiota bacterium]